MIFSVQNLLFILQGALEFLPVSSTAHMVLFSKWSRLPSLETAQAAALHLIPGLFLCFVFRRDILHLIKGLFSFGCQFLSSSTRRNSELPKTPKSGGCKSEAQDDPCLTLFKAVLWGTFPTLLVGLLLSLFHIEIPNSVVIIGSNSIIFGLLMGLIDSKTPILPDKVWTQRQGLILGLLQILAFIPGVSRLGICLTIARAMGFSRESSARFSFLCGIPVLLSAGLLGLLKTPSIFLSFFSWPMLFLCLGTIFLGGIILYLFTESLRSHTLKSLAVYRVGLGLLILLCI